MNALQKRNVIHYVTEYTICSKLYIVNSVH
jgi:hypothetical protein